MSVLLGVGFNKSFCRFFLSLSGGSRDGFLPRSEELCQEAGPQVACSAAPAAPAASIVGHADAPARRCANCRRCHAKVCDLLFLAARRLAYLFAFALSSLKDVNEKQGQGARPHHAVR